MTWRILILILGASCVPAAEARAQVTSGTAPHPDELNLSVGLGGGRATNPAFRLEGRYVSRRARLSPFEHFFYCLNLLQNNAAVPTQTVKQSMSAFSEPQEWFGAVPVGNLRCNCDESRTRNFEGLRRIIRPSGRVSTQRYSGEYWVAARRSTAYSRPRNNVSASPESRLGGTWSSQAAFPNRVEDWTFVTVGKP